MEAWNSRQGQIVERRRQGQDCLSSEGDGENRVYVQEGHPHAEDRPTMKLFQFYLLESNATVFFMYLIMLAKDWFS